MKSAWLTGSISARSYLAGSGGFAPAAACRTIPRRACARRGVNAPRRTTPSDRSASSAASSSGNANPRRSPATLPLFSVRRCEPPRMSSTIAGRASKTRARSSPAARSAAHTSHRMDRTQLLHGAQRARFQIQIHNSQFRGPRVRKHFPRRARLEMRASFASEPGASPRAMEVSSESRGSGRLIADTIDGVGIERTQISAPDGSPARRL